jgi:hypothetical protein
MRRRRRSRSDLSVDHDRHAAYAREVADPPIQTEAPLRLELTLSSSAACPE